MSRRCSTALAGCLVLTVITSAQAEDAPVSMPELGDVVYKGVVGKALDAVPMDPEHRVALQRTNAVVSNTIAGRSLSVWVGLTNPVLLIGGLVWGVFAAMNIKPETPVVLVSDAKQAGSAGRAGSLQCSVELPPDRPIPGESHVAAVTEQVR